MRQWLPAGHAVWLVIEAVRRLDTAAFRARRKTDGAGAAGYDPDMMVTLLVWAYANGITSSRRIERLCQQDVARARPRDSSSRAKVSMSARRTVNSGHGS
jgi:transposase